MTKHFFWSLEEAMEEAKTERKDVGYNLHVYKLMREHLKEHGYKVPKEADLSQAVYDTISQYDKVKETYSNKLSFKERRELCAIMEFMSDELRKIVYIIEDAQAIIHEAWKENFQDNSNPL